MRFFDCLVFGAGSLVLLACGDEDAEDPVLTGFCAVEHVEGNVTVCDELFEEAPFVRLPPARSARVIAGLQGDSFIAPDGSKYSYRQNANAEDPEGQRHGVALYELKLSGKSVERFRPVVIFNESVFIQPFMGHAFEGLISRRVDDEYELEASLATRVEILEEVVDPPSPGVSYQAQARLANATSAVSSADGSCIPALTSYADEAPFDSGAVVTLGVSRAPWMHGVFDDEFVFDIFVDGTSMGTLMGNAFYRGPIDLLRGTLSPSGKYLGIGHSTPGVTPFLDLEWVEGGGTPCTP